MAEGWSCPQCGLVLAPHVNEHRCDPPEAGTVALPYIGDPPGSGSMSISTATLPGTVTVNVTGSAVSADDMARRVQGALLRQARMNRQAGLQLPGRAA
jgi:hypothetical protein